MKKQIDVSVIVPIYNVEEFLGECLDSLRRQGDINLEVIMIDDGSTDSSGELADRYAEAYPNFVCVHIPNGGLGHARNLGVSKANGKYITFMDSDDIIPDNTYAKMFRMAEKNGSELTICNVERFSSSFTKLSNLHNRLFRDTVAVTHISEKPDLINDTIACNKLILKEFYDRNGFSFPEGIVYEDIPVTIPMHILCNKVSMMAEVGYRWRVRDGATKSITQKTVAMKNLKDRLTSIGLLDKFFKENVTDQTLIEAKQIKSLEIDLDIFVRNCASVPESEALVILDMLNEYIDQEIDPEMFSRIPVLQQQRYTYVRERNLEKLIEILNYNQYNTAKITEENGRLIASLPEDLFTIETRDVTNEIKSQPPRVAIDDFYITDNALVIAAHLYWKRFSIRKDEQKISAYLTNNIDRIELDVEPRNDGWMTKNYGTLVDKNTKEVVHYNYDGAAFIITLDLRKIEGKVEDDQYHIMLHYNNRLVEGECILRGLKRAVKEVADGRTVIEGSLSAAVQISKAKELYINVRKDTPILSKVQMDDKNLQFTLENDTEELIAYEQGGDISNGFAMNSKGNRVFEIPADLLKEGSTYLFSDKRKQGGALFARKSDAQILTGAKNAIISAFVTNEVKLRILSSITYLETIRQEKSTVHIKAIGDINCSKTVERVRLIVEDRISKNKKTLAEDRCYKSSEGMIESNFIIDFADLEITKDFYAGRRDLLIEYVFADDDCLTGNLYCNKMIRNTIWDKNLRIEIYTSRAATIRMKLLTEKKKGEETAEKLKASILQKYPLYRKLRIRKNRIMFESMWGKSYSCNPQALYEFIDKNYPEYECIWSLNDERIPIAGKAIRVRRNSLKYYYYLATSKYLVNNVNYPDDYVKRPGQIEIQTMHGTPLKTIGLDVTEDFKTQKQKDNYIEKSQRWDYLITQGRFVEDRADRIFGYKRQILRTGYPRTDRLYTFDNEKKQATKKQLGLPLDKKIILYAPTWRAKNRFDMELSLDDMRSKLSDEYILLIRLHHFSQKGYKIPEDREFIFDFNKYNYVENLYAISDVLITDYSSVMFDFALLNKPMVFFTYDMEEYCDKLRGLYVDFRNEAPGPICMTSDEVIDALMNIDDEMLKCKDRIKAFTEKYLTYENDHSAELVMEQVFKPSKMKRFMYTTETALRRSKPAKFLRKVMKKN